MPESVLTWYDFRREDVHVIAHQENEVRKLFGGLVLKASFDNPESLDAAQALRDNFEQFSNDWFAAQAVLRGMSEAQGLLGEEHELNGAAIRDLRERAGLSQKGVAKLLPGVSQSMLSRVESGNAPRRTMFNVYRRLQELTSNDDR